MKKWCHFLAKYKLHYTYLFVLTHWGRVTHICVSKLTITGSDNGLSPERRQAIIWTNAGILLIGPLGTNFSGTSIEIQIFSFKKMHLKMSSAKWRLFRLGLNELISVAKISPYKKSCLPNAGDTWWGWVKSLPLQYCKAGNQSPRDQSPQRSPVHRASQWCPRTN